MAERKSILLRLDPAVHDALVRWADDQLRSTNAQIEFLLRQALVDAGRVPGAAVRLPQHRKPPEVNPEPDDAAYDVAPQPLVGATRTGIGRREVE